MVAALALTSLAAMQASTGIPQGHPRSIFTVTYELPNGKEGEKIVTWSKESALPESKPTWGPPFPIKSFKTATLADPENSVETVTVTKTRIRRPTHTRKVVTKTVDVDSTKSARPTVYTILTKTVEAEPTKAIDAEPTEDADYFSAAAEATAIGRVGGNEFLTYIRP